MGKVDMNEIIKVSPSVERPYPQMRCVIGGAKEKYFEMVTRSRALAILNEGFQLNLIKEKDGVETERVALTKDYLLNTPTEEDTVDEEEETVEHQPVTEEVITHTEKVVEKKVSEPLAVQSEKKKQNPLKR